MVVIQIFINSFDKINFSFDPSHRHSTTVSLETRNPFSSACLTEAWDLTNTASFSLKQQKQKYFPEFVSVYLHV